MFDAAFPDADAITLVQAANALAAFQTVAFRSNDSPFDRYIAGDASSFNATERAGMTLFYGKASCANCHSGLLVER